MPGCTQLQHLTFCHLEPMCIALPPLAQDSEPLLSNYAAPPLKEFNQVSVPSETDNLRSVWTTLSDT